MPEIHEKTLTSLFDPELVSHCLCEMIASARVKHGLAGVVGVTLDVPTYERCRAEYSERYGTKLTGDRFDILTANGKCRVSCQ